MNNQSANRRKISSATALFVSSTLCWHIGTIERVDAFSTAVSRACTLQRTPSLITRNNGSSSRIILSALDDSEDAAQQQEQDRLLSLLGFIQNRVEDRLPCGLDASEKEQELVASVIAEVEKDDTNNLVTIQKGKIEHKDLIGNWKLMYTSSRAMIINKSLSGLGRSESETARFVSLVQKLSGSKYFGTAEFVEQFGQDESGLQVFVPGIWDTKSNTDAFTGAPCTSVAIDPERVVYGNSINSADDWGSLGPIKLLDLLYLSQDMMISRVNANSESLFVWQRMQQYPIDNKL